MPVIEELETTQQTEPYLPTAKRSAKVGYTAVELLRPWLQTAVTTVALFLFVITFLIQGFCVFGSCMEPNLRTGERVLGNKLVYRLKSPVRGEVVVFKYPQDPEKVYIKRVIGLPGETIEIRGGKVYIDGWLLSEPYLAHTPHGYYGPERIKTGNLFVMGDYRDQSNDSRYWGELPIENIQAKAWLRYWPVKRLTLLR